MKPNVSMVWTLCALLGACASQPKEPPRIFMQGFSLSAPDEKEWIVAKKSPDLTVIGKQGRFSGETFSMQAIILKLPAFESVDAMVRHVESTQRKEIDPKRFRLIKLEVVSQKIHDQDCALSRLDVAERTTGDGISSPVNTMVESMTLICPHPKDPLRAISMAYAHRHYPEDVDPQFAHDAALLMQTLKFEPL